MLRKQHCLHREDGYCYERGQTLAIPNTLNVTAPRVRYQIYDRCTRELYQRIADARDVVNAVVLWESRKLLGNTYRGNFWGRR